MISAFGVEHLELAKGTRANWTGVGAGVGAVTGALAGSIVGAPRLGAEIGAAGGALHGSFVGEMAARRKAKRIAIPVAAPDAAPDATQVAKSDRGRQAAVGGLAAGSLAAGGTAEYYRRIAGGHASASNEQRAIAERRFASAERRVGLHGDSLARGPKVATPKVANLMRPNQKNLRATGRILASGRAADERAALAARASFASMRRAKGAGAAALGLGAGALALHHNRHKPSLESHGYR